MKKGSTLKFKKGFTLAEVLLVIAIIGILAGVGFVGYTTMLKNARQKSADKAAESIALAFQSRLQEIYAFEYLSREILKSGSNSIDGTKYNIGKSGSTYIGSGDVEEAMGILTENGQVIASEFYDNGFMLEYDPLSCKVYSVTYLSDINKYSLDDVYAGIDRVSADNRKSSYKGYAGYFGMTGDASDSGDEALLDNNTTNNIILRVGHYVNGERRLYNYDELIAYIDMAVPSAESDITFKQRVNEKYIRLEVNVKGLSSGKELTYSIWDKWAIGIFHNICDVDDNVSNNGYSIKSIPIVLDSFNLSSANKSQRFADQFCSENQHIYGLDEKWSGSKYIKSSGALFPGENIEITVKAATYNSNSGFESGEPADDPLLYAETKSTDNSLYAYDNGLTEGYKTTIKKASDNSYVFDQPFIAYGRHLQNLDASSGIIKSDGTAGPIGATDIEAVQTKDIFFGDGSPETDDGKKIRIWKTVYAATPNLLPITNNLLKSYDSLTNPKYSASDPSTFEHYAIHDLVVDETADGITKSAVKRTTEKLNAGLFDSFGGTGITNLTIDKATISGVENDTGITGVVAGTIDRSTQAAASDITIKDITIKEPIINAEDNDNVGGLAGKVLATNITSKVTFDHVIVIDPQIMASAEASAGGLVGYSECKLDVKNSEVQVSGTEAVDGKEQPKGWIKTSEDTGDNP